MKTNNEIAQPAKADRRLLHRGSIEPGCVSRGCGIESLGGRKFVNAHLLALEKAPSIGFGRYIVSATTPFTRDDLFDLRANAPLVLQRRVPAYEAEYARRGWKMFPGIERVYVNERARNDLGWRPRYDFGYVLDSLRAGADPTSPPAPADCVRAAATGRCAVTRRPRSSTTAQ